MCVLETCNTSLEPFQSLSFLQRKYIPLELFCLLLLTSPITTIVMVPKLLVYIEIYFNCVVLHIKQFGEIMVIVYGANYNKLYKLFKDARMKSLASFRLVEWYSTPTLMIQNYC